MLATIVELRAREQDHRAAPVKAARPRKKESLAAYRRRIQRAIDANGPRAWHLIAMVKTAKIGPDPETALVYLQRLRDTLDDVLAATLPR